MLKLRIAADWRLVEGGDDNQLQMKFAEYFLTGKFNKLSLLEWVCSDGSAGSMPPEIVDERMYKRPETS